MTTFAYVAMDAAGKRRNGVIDAPTEQAAIQAVQAEGRYVLEIEQQADVTAANDGRKRGKVSRADIALFTRRMADLADAGLPLDRVIAVVAEQSENGTLADVAEDVLAKVRTGIPISAALADHPRHFDEIFTQTLRAGEASGQFSQVASRLADFQEKEVARRSQVVSALIYPSILAMTAVGVVIFLLTFVMPRLGGVFEGLGDDLPATTRILLATTDLLTKNYFVVIGGLVGLVVGYRMWVATEAGALARDRFMLKAPLLGPVVQKATISRFARVLGTLVYGGVPILEGLDLAGLASGNRLFRVSARQVESEVREGRPIAEAMRDTGAFPPVLTNMVAVGEETGDLPKMLNRVSDSLDFEVDNGMRRLTSLVEPIIVLGMGTFVGFVVLSVLLPIFQAQNAIK